LKRRLLVASFIGAICTVLAFSSGKADAGLFAGSKPAAQATATPTAEPSALPTATPEPPSIAIPRLTEKLKTDPNDRASMSELAMQYLVVGRPDLSLPLTQRSPTWLDPGGQHRSMLRVQCQNTGLRLPSGNWESLSLQATALSFAVMVQDALISTKSSGSLETAYRAT